MSIVVTPQPDHVPPRVRIDLDTDDPTKPFTSLAVHRDGKPIRDQPFVGGSEAVAFDYEAPFGIPVTYSADGAAADTPVTTYTTAWVNLTGWSTVTGTPAVSGGRLTSGRVSRPATLPTRGLLTMNATFGGSQFSLPFLELGSALKVTKRSDGVSVSVKFGTVTKTIGWTAGALKIQWDDVGAVVVADGVSTQFTAPLTNSDPTIYAAATGGTAPTVAGFSIVDQGTPTPFAASVSTTLNTTEAWLIHPTFPALSVSLDPGQHKFRDDGINVARATKASVASASKATRHDPAGSDRPVFFTSGPRSAGEWSLILRTRRLVDRDAISAITRDQSTLLLRSPAGWTWDLPDDWYSVAETEESRPRDGLHHADREVTLPLTPAREPAVRLAAQWTFAADLLRNPTFADSLAEFPTFLDRLAGP